MTSPLQTPPIHVLRSILRHIKSAPKKSLPVPKEASSSSSSPSSYSTQQHPLAQHVLNQYRTSQHISPTSSKSIQMRKMAYDYHVLKNDLKERARLHELDGGVESKLSPKEMSRRAAARAGLLPPEEFVQK